MALAVVELAGFAVAAVESAQIAVAENALDVVDAAVFVAVVFAADVLCVAADVLCVAAADAVAQPSPAVLVVQKRSVAVWTVIDVVTLDVTAVADCPPSQFPHERM